MSSLDVAPRLYKRGIILLIVFAGTSLLLAQAMMPSLPDAVIASDAMRLASAHGPRPVAGQVPSDGLRPRTPQHAVAAWQRQPATHSTAQESTGPRSGSDNNCAGATAVTLTDQGDGHYTGSEVLSFVAPLDEVAGSEYPTCYGGYMVCNNVWRKFTATGTDATIGCCYSTATYPDSIIEVYSGTCTSRVALACNDDSPNCGVSAVGDVGARVLVTGLIPGQTYLVQVGVRRYGEAAYTEGDYTLTIDCYSSCTITCTATSTEDELQPCGDPASTHINDGCNVDGKPLFAQIFCNESICGTTMFDGANRDVDCYRWVTPTSGFVTFSAKAEFYPSLQVLGAADLGQPISCDNYRVLVANDPGGYEPCSDPNSPSTSLGICVAAGEYWFVIAPSEIHGLVACGRQYQITLTADPCDPAPGACCVDGVCMSNTNQLECVDIYSGVWYGDGSDCAVITCFVCPEGAGVEDTFGQTGIAEKTCDMPGYYPDVRNAGCGADVPDPDSAFTPFECGEAICGTSGAYLAPPADPSANLRDNDWFMLLDIPGEPDDWIRVAVEYLGEFPAEVHIASHTDIDNPCDTWSVEATRYAEPGELVEFSACVKKKDYAPGGQAWVIVRPSRRGAPREVPCGVRYYLKVDCDTCGSYGACCRGMDGCEMLSVEACAAAGGVFGGEGVICEEACCPCGPGNTPENEVDGWGDPLCGYTYFEGDNWDEHNGGCVSSAEIPDDVAALEIDIGEHICGTLGTVSSPPAVYRDFDYYAIQLGDPNSPSDPNNPHQYEVHVRLYVQGTNAVIPAYSRVPAYPDCEDSENWFRPTVPLPECEWTEYVIEEAAEGWWLVGATLDFASPDWLPDECYPYELYVEVDPVLGACCLDEHTCQDAMTQGECETAGGWHLGAGSQCATTVVHEFEERSGTVVHKVTVYADCGRARDNWKEVREQAQLISLATGQCVQVAIVDSVATVGTMVGDATSGTGPIPFPVQTAQMRRDFVDCNGNGIDDIEDITGGESEDCNGNWVPDECDISSGTSEDCQANEIPDECDIAVGTSTDCSLNGIPDECERDMDPNTPCFYFDAWITPEITHDFGSNDPNALPIPAGFFGVSSLPYDGVVSLIGSPPAADPNDPNFPLCFNGADTIIERQSDPFNRVLLPPEFPYEAPNSVAVRLVALSLESTAPIVVEYLGGRTEQWDVKVAVSNVEPPYGQLTVTRTHCHGGTFVTDTLPVYPRFTFTRVSDGLVRVLDTGELGWDPIDLKHESPHPWLTELHPSIGGRNDVCTDFHPSVGPVGETTVSCDCNTNGTRDDFDIADKVSLDHDGNGVPDECEYTLGQCSGDMNCDGVVDYDDIAYFTAAMTCLSGAPDCWPPAGVPVYCSWLNGDCTGDCNVTYADIDCFVNRIGTTCP